MQIRATIACIVAFLLGAALAFGGEPVKYSPVMPPVKGRIVYVTPNAYPATKAYNDRLKNPATIVVVPGPCQQNTLRVHRSPPQKRHFKDFVPEAEPFHYEPAPIMFDFSEPAKPQLIINRFVCPK